MTRYAHDDPLRGLATEPCAFAPTFKVARGREGAIYSAKRVPAWTQNTGAPCRFFSRRDAPLLRRDRVLYAARSRPGRTCALRVDAYAAAPAVSTSDHKPVVLTATLSVHADRPAPPDASGLTLT